ncbi:MAG: phosphatidylserine/phosphatidylglycerophosphate/cardiolipin synthase family protein [Planctomycetaceae bacterium]
MVATPDVDDAPGIALLSDWNDPDGAALTFQRVIQGIRDATQSVVIHMFVWRNDAIGNEIGREVLAAAERGVKVRIKKDVGAFMYERIEMNRKSFFNKPISAGKRLMYKLSGFTFPDTYVEDDYDDALGNRLMAHENVAIEWVDHTHTKYYIFDDRTMIIGSINIEDRHRGYRDYVVEITGRDHVERFHARNGGVAACDPGRSIDFVLNAVDGGRKRFEIKPAMLELIAQARQSLYLEMAYIGDPDVSRAIVAAAGRGVRVTMLFSKAANIGNDINYRSLYRICKRADMEVTLSDKMIHSKLMLIDGETVILGSANISVFSMQKAVELDVVVRDDPTFIATVQQTIDRRMAEGRKVESIAELAGYNRVIASLQQLHQLIH